MRFQKGAGRAKPLTGSSGTRVALERGAFTVNRASPSASFRIPAIVG